MISLSGDPKYSSTRLLTYSILPSGAALHTNAGIASTSKRSSCSVLVSASSALLSSLDKIAPPQIARLRPSEAESLKIPDSYCHLIRPVARTHATTASLRTSNPPRAHGSHPSPPPRHACREPRHLPPNQTSRAKSVSSVGSAEGPWPTG